MQLQKLQRNDIFEAIREAGLPPEEFDWNSSEDASRLQHRPSDAYFDFKGVAGNYVSRYLAGDAPVEERAGLSQYRLMQQVRLSLAAVKQDIDAPDLWAQLQREAESLGAISDEAIANTPLSPAEQEEIAERLGELRRYVVTTYSLSGLQAGRLEERLDFLAAAASRDGRKDWLLMAAGVVLSFVLGAAFPPETVRDILGTILISIEHILGRGPLGLHGG